MASQYDMLLKLLLVGDTGVGKTCLLCRYITDDYIDTHITTLAIDFKTKLLPLDDKVIKVQIWDTAGQERFQSISRQFYRKAQGIFVVYDITNAKTFHSVEKWIAFIHKLADTDPCLLLIGNKSDTESPRQVSYEDAQKVADHYNMKFYEVSAKSTQNMEQAFVTLMREVMRKESLRGSVSVDIYESGSTAQKDIVKITDKPVNDQEKGGCCCIL